MVERLDPAASDQLKDQHDDRYNDQDVYKIADGRTSKSKPKCPKHQ